MIIFLPEAPVLAGTAPKVKQKMKIFENILGGLRPLRTGPALPGATASASEQARIELEGNRRLNMDALEIGILGFNRKFGSAGLIALGNTNTSSAVLSPNSRRFPLSILMAKKCANRPAIFLSQLARKLNLKETLPASLLNELNIS